MKYPPCATEDRCRFRHLGGFSTDMYSPIEYDREGTAVGGGMNHQSQRMQCGACGKKWAATGTELEFAQGKVEWQPDAHPASIPQATARQDAKTNPEGQT